MNEPVPFDDGGPAFARAPAFSPECGTMEGTVGASLWDYYAAAALPAVAAAMMHGSYADISLAIAEKKGITLAVMMAQDAAEIADACIAEKRHREAAEKGYA